MGPASRSADIEQPSSMDAYEDAIRNWSCNTSHYDTTAPAWDVGLSDAFDGICNPFQQNDTSFPYDLEKLFPGVV
jgi:hypothetical protein